MHDNTFRSCRLCRNRGSGRRAYVGEDRFKILAKQVDRRIRLGPPLMQETINRLSAVNLNYSELEIAKEMRPRCPGQERAIEESPRNASETFKTS
jgi:hypothetical protein